MDESIAKSAIDFPYVFKWLYHRDKLNFQNLLRLLLIYLIL